MSYDLTLYTRGDLIEEILTRVRAEPDLQVQSENGGLIVYRGEKRLYCCTIGPAQLVETEDLPDEIASRSVEVTHQVEILVEGSASAAISRTRRLARALVSDVGGWSYDHQTEQVNPAALRSVSVPSSRGIVDIVSLHWYTASHDGLASLLLESARRFVPEALPRRFGSFEPMQFRLDRDGEDAFIREAAKESLLFWKGSGPVVHAALSQASTGIAALSVDLLASSLDDPGFRAAVRAFFLDIAEASASFLATGEVVRGYEWSGRSLWIGAEVEPTYNVRGREGWMGLPPHPVWWSYFGAGYAEALSEDVLQVEQRRNGVFLELSDAPRNREQLARALPRRGIRRRAIPWVPLPLQVRPLPTDGRRMPPPALRAEFIPDNLGVSIAPSDYQI